MPRKAVSTAKQNQIKNSARVAAFKLIDEMLSLPKNLKRLKDAMQDAFEEDPVLFYKQFIKPTAEKEFLLVVDDDKPVGKVRIIYADEAEEQGAE